jgi:hypothetical protein
MKTQNHLFTVAMVAIASLLWSGALPIHAAGTHPESATETEISPAHAQSEPGSSANRAWLGVTVEEASEALIEQLGLEPGVGLVVTHISSNSPAAKAGLRRNDVLAELDGHALAHPAQLRRLVQARQPGDDVTLLFYRGGKRQTEWVELEPAPARFGFFDEHFSPERLRQFQRDLFDLPNSEEFRAQSKALRDAFRPLPEEMRSKMESEIQRGMEQARKALEEAMRELERNKGALRKEGGRLRELLRSGVTVDDDATIVVRTKGKTARTIVKTDEFGTIIVTGPPHLHLTARDKSGELLFDGSIETPEQRAKVPAEVWKRVAPLVDEDSAGTDSDNTEP